MNFISGISSILAIGLLSPVQSILFMVILFVSTALSLYSYGFELMGILYILVYVGAIAILFLFILSLLKIDYHPSDKLSYSLLGFLAIIFLPLDLFSNINGIAETISFTSNELYIIGNLFYTDYSILLIIIGIVLILSIIGAIGITK